MCVIFFILVAVPLVTAMQRAVITLSAIRLQENASVKTTLKVISVIGVRTAPSICNRTTNMVVVEVCIES